MVGPLLHPVGLVEIIWEPSENRSMCVPCISAPGFSKYLREIGTPRMALVADAGTYRDLLGTTARASSGTGRGAGGRWSPRNGTEAPGHSRARNETTST